MAGKRPGGKGSSVPLTPDPFTWRPKKELIINDDNWRGHAPPPEIDGERRAKGLVPRDYNEYPMCYSRRSLPFGAVDMKLIPRNEYAERIREKESAESGLHYLRRTAIDGRAIPSLDQNGQGYCWCYSVAFCLMISRVLAGLPYVRLSAHAVACVIKKFRDEGGWGALCMDFVIERGMPDVNHWPEKSMSRSHDKPETWENAKNYRPGEFWMDMAPPVYNRNLSEDQACTALLTDCPVVGDFNWWGHSVCLLALTMSRQAMRKKSLLKTDFDSLDLMNKKDLQVYEAAFGKRGINSWTDNWGENGEFVLEGSRATLNGGLSVRTVNPSLAA